MKNKNHDELDDPESISAAPCCHRNHPISKQPLLQTSLKELQRKPRKTPKYANGIRVFIFVYFAWFAVETDLMQTFQG